MNNNTAQYAELTTAPERPLQTLTAFFYALFGGLSLLSCVVVVAAICNIGQLRSKTSLILLGGIIFGESVVSLAYFLAGVYRVALLSRAENSEFVTGLFCFALPYCLLFTFGQPLQASMMLAASVDRLICVLNFSTYSKRGHGYRMILLSFPIGNSVIYAIFGIFLALLDPRLGMVSPLCNSAAPWPAYYNYYESYGALIQSTASVIVYIISFIIMFLNASRERLQTSTFPSIQMKRYKRERQATILLGILALITLFAYALPQIVAQVLNLMNFCQAAGPIMTAVYDVQAGYSMFSIFICIRQSEIRDKLSGWLRCVRSLRIHYSSSSAARVDVAPESTTRSVTRPHPEHIDVY